MLFFSILLALLRICVFDCPAGSLQVYEGSSASFDGVVTGVSIKETYTALTVKIKGEKVLVRVSFPGNDDRAKLYDLVGRKVRVTGKISLPAGRRNPK